MRVGTINIKTAKNRLIHDLMDFGKENFYDDIMDTYYGINDPDFYGDTKIMVDTLDFEPFIRYIKDTEGSEKIIQKIENYKKLVV